MYEFTDALWDGITEHLNKLGAAHACPPLDWTLSRYSGLTGTARKDAYSPAELPAVLKAWADHLELTPVEHPTVGTIEYQGHLEGWAVAVWGVADREVFDRAVNRDRS